MNINCQFKKHQDGIAIIYKMIYIKEKYREYLKQFEKIEHEHHKVERKRRKEYDKAFQEKKYEHQTWTVIADAESLDKAIENEKHGFNLHSQLCRILYPILEPIVIEEQFRDVLVETAFRLALFLEKENSG